MTMFLASVASADEARTALDNGADLIDCKDPSNGALGALALETVKEVVTCVAGNRPVSGVTGDLPMDPGPLVAAATALADAGVDYVKVGLFFDLERAACIRSLAPVARRVQLIGVLFADRESDVDLLDILPQLNEHGFAGVMLDTAGKGNGCLLDHLPIEALDVFTAKAREFRLMTGLAGSLEAPDVPRLLMLAPDFLGFRGALCESQNRTSTMSSEAVALIRQLIPIDVRSATHKESVSKVDYRLLAARGYSNDPGKETGYTDRIFVHDLILPVSIGAYVREREHTQRVRFNVDIDIQRSARVPEDMRDVVSYDIVTDGIKMIVAREHIALVETLAERVAALVLAHPRVVRVTVRIEKLDIGAGGVGVEIKRDRTLDAPSVRHLGQTPLTETDPRAAY
jgi:FolB domain-containing protein